MLFITYSVVLLYNYNDLINNLLVRRFVQYRCPQRPYRILITPKVEIAPSLRFAHYTVAAELDAAVAAAAGTATRLQRAELLEGVRRLLPC